MLQGKRLLMKGMEMAQQPECRSIRPRVNTPTTNSPITWGLMCRVFL